MLAACRRAAVGKLNSKVPVSWVDGISRNSTEGASHQPRKTCAARYDGFLYSKFSWPWELGCLAMGRFAHGRQEMDWLNWFETGPKQPKCRQRSSPSCRPRFSLHACSSSCSNLSSCCLSLWAKTSFIQGAGGKARRGTSSTGQFDTMVL